MLFKIYAIYLLEISKAAYSEITDYIYVCIYLFTCLLCIKYINNYRGKKEQDSEINRRTYLNKNAGHILKTRIYIYSILKIGQVLLLM